MNSGFPPVSAAEWEAQIAADLKGADYEKKLVWRTPEGLSVRPYYTMETAPAALAIESPASWQQGEVAVDVDASVFADAGATAVEELAFALAAAVADWKTQTPTVRFAGGPLFLLEIAKLRAARAMFENAGLGLRIEAVTARWNKSALDRNNNLLRATSEALAAAIGGADWIRVRAAGIDARLAENILHVLREECSLGGVADPAAGAWYIEALTEMLGQEAWKRFQAIEAGGGFGSFRESGGLEQALAASRKARESAYATRRATLVGVNNYPNPGERIEAMEEDGWRASGLLERIRLRTERHVAGGAERPTVLLLQLGDAKMSQLRAGFCRNFLGCAGFAIREGSRLEPASLVVLCGSDAEYPELAPRVLSEAQMPVLIAGYPKEHVAGLEAAGVAGFVHLGSNLPETLETWQSRLGVSA
ncbi:MAG: hypothetical protein JNK48_28430 [Bryobacterales bacterium]|nr:hypothetical protein [Bryobacterales bacterium]